MPALLLGGADAISGEIERRLQERNLAYKKLDLDAKLREFLLCAAENLAIKLGGTYETLRPHITDFVSFGASIYEPHHTMDVTKRADTLQLGHAELHSLDLGGASVPAALEIARRLVANEDRLVLIAGSEVPRGGPGGVQYYREVSDALLEKNSELHTRANLISLYALLADRMMFEHDISQSEIDAITKHYREQAIANERAAVYQKPLKDGELSRFLAGPYATAMVAVATDHGAAFLVGNETSLGRLKAAGFMPSQPVLCIRGVGTHHAPKYLTQRADFNSPAAVAAERAFTRAGLKREAIDYAWIYDCFTLMLVRQAADYFHLDARSTAMTLAHGELHLNGKVIEVNHQGGILNNQAAISLSAATGLMDILDFAAQHGNEMHFLFGGNGGIDCINSVAILSRDQGLSMPEVVDAPAVQQRTSAAPKETEMATLYAAVMVRFNPGAPVPFCLGCFRRENGSLFLARVYNRGFEVLTDTSALQHDRTSITVRMLDGAPVAVLD